MRDVWGLGGIVWEMDGFGVEMGDARWEKLRVAGLFSEMLSGK